jgi:hypothetical protein
MAGGDIRANRPERLKPLNPEPKHLDAKEVTDLSDPGYRCVGRRPRLGGYTDILPNEQADRIEEISRDMPTIYDSYE